MTKNKYAIVSGGFDPLHDGHLDMIDFAATYGKVIVLLNSDAWLTRKKGKPFMNFILRSRILNALENVWLVCAVNDDDGTVCQGLKEYMNASMLGNIADKIYFINGGDRTNKTTPELEVCKEAGIIPVFMNDKKSNSSSNLLEEWVDFKTEKHLFTEHSHFVQRLRERFDLSDGHIKNIIKNILKNHNSFPIVLEDCGRVWRRYRISSKASFYFLTRIGGLAQNVPLTALTEEMFEKRKKEIENE